MQHFVEELIPAISAVFESDEYRSRIDAMQEEEKHREEAALHELGHRGRARGRLPAHPHGFAFVPMKSAEATMSQEEFEQLPEERQQALTGHIKAMHERLHKLMNDFPRWRRDMQNRIKEAGSEALRTTVTHLMDDLKPAYADLPAVGAYLDAALQDIIESGESLRESSAARTTAKPPPTPGRSPCSATWSISSSKPRPTAAGRWFTKTIRPCRTSSGASNTWCTWAP
jgi:hypothetical protein